MSGRTPASIAARVRRFLLTLAIAGMALQASAQDSTPAPPQVGISPTRFELEIGARPTVESFRVINFGDQPLEIRISVAHWRMDERNQVAVVAPTEQSLDQWMVINPLRFTIPPGGTQAVRFSVRPRVEPEDGEHRAMIYLKQVLSEDGGDGASGIRFRFQYGVTVYGYAGETRRAGELHAVTAAFGTGAVRFDFDLSSTGNAHVRMSGQYAIWPAGAYPGSERTEQITGKDAQPPPAVLHAGDLPALPVLAGTRRIMQLQPKLELPAGSYVLDVNGTLHDEILDLAVPFTVTSRPSEPSERR